MRVCGVKAAAVVVAEEMTVVEAVAEQLAVTVEVPLRDTEVAGVDVAVRGPR